MAVSDDPPAGIRASTVYLPALEGLRGVAALLVLAYHADCDARSPFAYKLGQWPALPLAFVLGGHTGVSLFFVLSAFLLSMPFLDEAAGHRAVSRGAFYRRRALRILPLYWTVMVVGSLVSAATPIETLRGAKYLVFLNGFTPTAMFAPFTDVTWSLATEVQFYLLLPLLPYCLGSPVRRRVGWGALAALVGIYAGFLGGPLRSGTLGWVLGNGIVGRGPTFLFGILAAWTYRRYGSRLSQAGALRRPFGDLALLLCLLALAVLLRLVVNHGYTNWEASAHHGWHTLEGALWSAVVLLVVVAPLVVRPLLVNPLLARIGVLSYSIYLVHQPTLVYSFMVVRRTFHLGVGWNPREVPWLVGGVLLVFGLSTLTYRGIERPFLVRKARLDA